MIASTSLMLSDVAPVPVAADASVRATTEQLSEATQQLCHHLLADAPWDPAVIGQARPDDLIRACRFVSYEAGLDTFDALQAISHRGERLSVAQRHLLQWGFLARVRLRELLPHMRSAVALTFLPPGGRFKVSQTAERLGCTQTVVMQLIPMQVSRVGFFMRGYVAQMDGHGRILGIGGPEGCKFAKNFGLLPGIRRLDSRLRAIKACDYLASEAIASRCRRTIQRRRDMFLDETLFPDARAARPDLENATIMGLGLELLCALRSFAEHRRANEELDRLASSCGVESREDLVADPSLAAGDEHRVAVLALRREQALRHHAVPGMLQFQRLLYAFSPDSLIPSSVAVPGVDGPCLTPPMLDDLRARGNSLQPMTQVEDFSELVARLGVHTWQGRRILEARSHGMGDQRRWLVRLADTRPEASILELTSTQYLEGLELAVKPQVVDVVHGQLIRRAQRYPFASELRFQRDGLFIDVSVDDVHPSFSEWRQRQPPLQ